MVGGLYKVDNKRDTGFYIFYMGINLGAFFSIDRWGCTLQNMDGTIVLD